MARTLLNCIVIVALAAGSVRSFAEPLTAPPAGRAFHFAGGRMKSQVKLGENYSVAFFLWNALPADARAVTGYAFSRGKDGDKERGEHLGIGGTYKAEAQGRLILFNGNAADQLLIGQTKLALKAWHHVVLVREGAKVRVHLDGKPVPDLEGELPVVIESNDVFIGGRADNFANREGKLDEVAIFARALAPNEASQLFQAAKMPPPVTANAPDFPPLSPEDALKSIHVPDGFKVELVACEPNVIDPIAIDWDLAGRLWVVEMADYPSGMDNNGKPGGRVRVLEDTDGDGRYEKSTLFADGLNFPTGLLTWRDGVIVTAAPDVLFLKDTNGDGKADSTEKLLSGLMEGNQQLRANGLRWGLDNRVYCAAGGHHGGHGADTVLRSHRDGQDVPIGSRDFSFDPDMGDVRAESGPSQFGRNRDDAGHWFGTQNSRALWQYVLPDHYLKRNPYVPAPDPANLIVTPLNAPVYPLSPPEKRFHSFEHSSHFTSACSGMIYRDELLWPRRDNELDAFTCEPFHNLVQHNILVEDGVTYKAKRAPGEEKHDFFASTDRWCRPVMTRTGPDGALWVVDMYRYMIEHPAWLPESGKAETLPFYRLGDDKGRIYRVFRTGKPPRKVHPLIKLKPVELVKALDSPNEWQRDKAHMALMWTWKGRDSSDFWEQCDDDFRQVLESPLACVRVQAYWMLYDLYGLPQGTAEGMLSDPSRVVREQALMLVRLGDYSRWMAAQALDFADDPDPKVRLRLALEIGEWNSAPGEPNMAERFQNCGKALARIASRDPADPWIHAAVMSSSVPHCRALCEGIAAAGGAAFDSYLEDLAVLSHALGDRDSLAIMLRPVFTADESRYTLGQINALSKFVNAMGRQRMNPARLIDEKDDALAGCLRRMHGMTMYARSTVADGTMPVTLRIACAKLLSPMYSDRTEDSKKYVHSLSTWLEPSADSELQLAAVSSLAMTGSPWVPRLLMERISSLLPATRDAAVDALLSHEDWALALLEHVKPNAGLALDAVQRARLSQHSSKKVRDLAASVLKAESSRKEVLENFRPALSLTGDAARGKVVFARCIGCHQLDGTGIQIGPDLKSVAGHPAEKLLTNIIDPSLDVQPGFFAFQGKLKDGSELYGLITSETGNSVTFKLTDGSSRLVLRSDLADLKSTGQSLMPAGLETGMTHQEMADLIAWLQSGTAGK